MFSLSAWTLARLFHVGQRARPRFCVTLHHLCLWRWAFTINLSIFKQHGPCFVVLFSVVELTVLGCLRPRYLSWSDATSLLTQKRCVCVVLLGPPSREGGRKSFCVPCNVWIFSMLFAPSHNRFLLHHPLSLDLFRLNVSFPVGPRDEKIVPEINGEQLHEKVH